MLEIILLRIVVFIAGDCKVQKLTRSIFIPAGMSLSLLSHQNELARSSGNCPEEESVA